MTAPSHWLLVLSQSGYRCEPLTGSGSLTFGRSRTCEIQIDDPSISRVHARLDIEGDKMWLTDLGSANGTQVRERLLVPDERCEISVGESLKLGRALVIVQDFQAPMVRPRNVLDGDAFRAAVDQACARAARTDDRFAVVDIDVAGVRSMAEAYTALAPSLESADAVGQTGARRYAAVFFGADTPSKISQLRQALHGAIVGQALYPSDGKTSAELCARAAQAGVGFEILGDNMRDLVTELDRIAGSDITILLTGETGVGKEVLAERAHRASQRRTASLVRINCGALNPLLLESELFGYVRGAFTGADRDKPGLLELAEGGTVFLDEIAELEVSLQVKLLRVVEERKVWRVGSTVPRPIDVRFIVATNRKLAEEIAAGRFRSDLYFRLSAAAFEIPPLRERPDEIEILANRFLADCERRTGEPTLSLSSASRKILRDYVWPGNVRELRNVIERAAALCEGDVIEPQHFPIDQMKPRTRFAAASNAGDDGPTLEMAPAARADSIDRDQIVESLSRNAGNQGRAASELGIHRRTLMRKMDLFKIPRPRKK